MESRERPRTPTAGAAQAQRMIGMPAEFPPLALPALAGAMHAGLAERMAQAKLASKRSSIVHEDEPAL